jgi:metal-responsive CopG/Arc/MetJ family transcriptional regulator
VDLDVCIIANWRPYRSVFKIDLNEAFRHGYTYGMKTAISIPDDLFEKGERLARRMKKSRSELYRRALGDYVARHAADQVTEAMDEVCAELGMETDKFVAGASRRILERSEW